MKSGAIATRSEITTTCAIIVSYHPDELIVQLTHALLQQVPQVVIVDNGSNAQSRARLQELARDDRVNLIWNSSNQGIATALNQGVRFAQRNGFIWVATFDQDSQVNEGYFAALFGALDMTPLAAQIAILAPRYLDPRTGVTSAFEGQHHQRSKRFVTLDVAMTSGNLVRCSAFEMVGMFWEELFVGYVDYEFCLRCRHHGLLIVGVTDAVLVHRPGNCVRRRFLWMNPVLSHYQPLRRYYNARNSVAVYRRHGLRRIRWMLSDMWELVRETAKVALLEEQKIPKLRAIFCGLLNGLAGRLGKVPDAGQCH